MQPENATPVEVRAISWPGALAGLAARARAAFTPRVRDLLLSGLSMMIGAIVFRILNDESLHHPGFDVDETYFVWGGWSITKGLIPYRDFIEFKPPLAFLTHALAIALYGFKSFQYRWFFLWFPMSSLIALHGALLSRRVDRLCALALILGLTQLWVNPQFHDVALSDTESIGLAYYFLGLACLIARTPSDGWLRVLGGAFFVASVLSKEPFLPCVVLTWAGCFLLDHHRSPTFRSDARLYTKRTAIGAAVVVVCLCLYMIPTGAMGPYLSMVRGYARLHRDPAQSYCVLLGRFHPTNTRFGDLKTEYQHARMEFLNLKVLGYLVPFAVAFLVFAWRRSRLLFVTAVGAFLFAMYAVTASNCQWKHYYNMTMSGVAFVLVVGLDSMQPALTASAVRRYVGWVLIASVLVVLVPRLRFESKDFGKRTFAEFKKDPAPGALAAVARYTGPADRVFTSGLPSFYVQTGRRSAIRESAIVDEALGYYEGKTDDEKLAPLRAELERNMPKIVVTDPLFRNRLRRTNRTLIFPFLTAHHYTEIGPSVWLRPY
jgi:hypothetical protein